MRYTTQEIFDKAIERFFNGQGKCGASGDGDNVCYYRHPNNPLFRCIVGVFIENSDYNEHMEGFSIKNLMNNGILPNYLVEHYEILGDLQMVHDFTSNWSGKDLNSIGIGKLNVIAKKYELTSNRYLGS